LDKSDSIRSEHMEVERKQRSQRDEEQRRRNIRQR
jgi:hypothetical protein